MEENNGCYVIKAEEQKFYISIIIPQKTTNVVLIIRREGVFICTEAYVSAKGITTNDVIVYNPLKEVIRQYEVR